MPQTEFSGFAGRSQYRAHPEEDRDRRIFSSSSHSPLDCLYDLTIGWLGPHVRNTIMPPIVESDGGASSWLTISTTAEHFDSLSPPLPLVPMEKKPCAVPGRNRVGRVVKWVDGKAYVFPFTTRLYVRGTAIPKKRRTSTARGFQDPTDAICIGDPPSSRGWTSVQLAGSTSQHTPSSTPQQATSRERTSSSNGSGRAVLETSGGCGPLVPLAPRGGLDLRPVADGYTPGATAHGCMRLPGCAGSST